MRQPAFLRPALLALLFAASAACAACWMKPHNQTDAQHPLECRMEEAHPQLAGGPVAIRFQLTNRADHPVWLLRWNTPWEGWRGTLFALSYGGQDLPYHGPQVQRGEPTAQEYIKLRPQESMITGLDFSQVHDVGRPGAYTVRVVAPLQDVIQDGAAPPRTRDKFQPLTLRCETLVLKVGKAKEAPKVNY
jgi:hypothetical protein